MSRRSLAFISGVALALSVGCGDDGPTPAPDAGESVQPDAATPADAGVADTGLEDIGPADTGPADTGPADTGPTLVDLLDTAEREGLSAFSAAADAAGLSAALRGPGPLTVLAPSNAAFTALGDAAPADPGLLANVLLNHVVDGERLAAAVLAADGLDTLARTRVAVDAAATPPTISGAPISATDVLATNGVVHVIDQVIVPPTIAAAVGATPDLDALAGAVGRVPAVAELLGQPGPLTVFAPVDAAFEGLDLSELAPEALAALLRFHVVDGQLLAADLTAGSTLTTANGAELGVSRDAQDNVVLTDVSGATVAVTLTDIRLLNGTVHLIDGVLDPIPPPTDIIGTARRAGANAIADAAAMVGIATTLINDPGPLTLLAPTDAALAQARMSPEWPTDPGLVENVLLYHVLPDALESAQLLQASTVASLAGQSLPLTVEAMPPSLAVGLSMRPADLSSTLDLLATNGVVHLLDGVLLPPTIEDMVGGVGVLSNLAILLASADASVRQAAFGRGPTTLFAPTNQELNDAIVNVLQGAPTLRDNVLRHHVAMGQVTFDFGSNQVVVDGVAAPSNTITMIDGRTVTVQFSGGNAVLQDAAGIRTGRVVNANVPLRTGTLHLLDDFLLPEAP